MSRDLLFMRLFTASLMQEEMTMSPGKPRIKELLL